MPATWDPVAIRPLTQDRPPGRDPGRQKFLRALDWAEQNRLIGIEEIDGVTYLRLIQPDGAADDES